MGFLLQSFAATAGFVKGLAIGGAVFGSACAYRRTCKSCGNKKETR
ncbi:MAG: hypothetical protein U5L06_05895 [Rhodovibrio sp.]|nr:hypothetical protein [Rhodovibrio sp.]